MRRALIALVGAGLAISIGCGKAGGSRHAGGVGAESVAAPRAQAMSPMVGPEGLSIADGRAEIPARLRVGDFNTEAYDPICENPFLMMRE